VEVLLRRRPGIAADGFKRLSRGSLDRQRLWGSGLRGRNMLGFVCEFFLEGSTSLNERGCYFGHVDIYLSDFE